jgi:hypothetical protein
MEVPPAAFLCFPLHSWGQTFPLSSQNFVTKMPIPHISGKGYLESPAALCLCRVTTFGVVLACQRLAELSRSACNCFFWFLKIDRFDID